MKTRIIRTIYGLAILAVVILFLAATTQAYPNWDIYSDTDIYSGTYGLINIYDTPPDHTAVNMYGCSADYISTFNSSTLNIYEGVADVGSFETSIINISGGDIEHATASDNGTVNFFGSSYTDSLLVEDSATVNIQGDSVERIIARNSGTSNLHAGSVIDYLTAYDSAVINIYGYDLVKTNSGGSYGDGQVYGYWINDVAFTINLRGVDTYLRINLIPEPSSLMLLGFGSLILRRKR